MQIVDFKHDHMEEAMKIARMNYEEERQQVKTLPNIDILPDLYHFTDNNLGVAAFEGNKMVGFMGCYSPIDNAWGTTYVKGTFSPIHAHGAIDEKRDKIYSLLYQAAANKWVKEGIVSHAIGLYAHDTKTLNNFFYNGFGLRCIDAIRPLDDIPLMEGTKCEYTELKKDEFNKLHIHQNALISHLGSSPIFMTYPPKSEEEFLGGITESTRFFAAKVNGESIAYIKIDLEGENFACEDTSMMNICGAYCLPEHRGNGISNNLLSFLVSSLKLEGFSRLGVDFESFNPTARGFWLKYFTPYTNSVVRRIDEKSVKG
ncbi:MAG: putative glycosyl hydrolase [Anaerocolumna sp.]|jgi:GNAT superfamily N-acetyltransferase|nr:putative glycosyl hydrolase [Anaerocolumna sp.]